MARNAEPATANGGARPDPGNQASDGPIIEHRRPQQRNAGVLDLRSEVAELDTRDLCYQIGWLVDAPYGLRRLTRPRLSEALAELSGRAATVLEEVAP